MHVLCHCRAPSTDRASARMRRAAEEKPVSPTRPQTTETSCWISQPVLQPVTPRRAAPPAEMITRARARQRVRPLAYAPDGHACFCSVCGRWHLLPTGVSAAAHCLLPQRRWHGLPQRRTYERHTHERTERCERRTYERRTYERRKRSQRPQRSTTAHDRPRAAPPR